MVRVQWLISDQNGCGSYRAYVPALGMQDRQTADSVGFVLHKQVNHPDQPGLLDDLDVLIFQRAVGDAFLATMREAKKRGIATIFETDDDLFKVHRSNPSHWYWNQKNTLRLLRAQMQMADRIIVSTVPLQRRVQEETGRPLNEIHICANHLHRHVWGPENFTRSMPFPNSKLVIGWQGSTTHDVDFKMALPALQRILAEYPNTVLRLFGSVPASIKGMLPESRFEWSKGVAFEFYPATLKYLNFDIGIAPVTDSQFNRAKSNIKWLEYSALGIPSVCSSVYPYAMSIEHGETGFLASNDDEWYRSLKALVESAELRQRIGRAAFDYVWREFATDVRVPAWERAIAEARTACTSSQIPTGTQSR